MLSGTPRRWLHPATISTSTPMRFIITLRACASGFGALLLLFAAKQTLLLGIRSQSSRLVAPLLGCPCDVWTRRLQVQRLLKGLPEGINELIHRDVLWPRSMQFPFNVNVE